MKIDDLHFVNAGNSSFIAASEDIFNGNPSTDVISLENHADIYFLIQKNAGVTGTATITIGSCDDTTPTTATAVAFEYKACTSGDTWGSWTAATSSGFTTTAGANQMYLVHVKGADLHSSNKFVRLTATEVVDSPCDGAIIAFLANHRYAPTPATVLS